MALGIVPKRDTVNSVLLTLVAVSLFALCATFDIVLIAAAVTLGTVIKLANALFYVFAPDVGRRVFVAAITGVAAIVIAYMAGHTTGGVVLVQHKVFVMLKSGRCPLLLGVALGTVAGDLLVQRIRR